MSKESLGAFLLHARQTDELSNALDHAFEEGLGAVIAMGERENFRFSERDFAAFESSSGTEITDGDLDHIAGAGRHAVSPGHTMIGSEAAKAFMRDYYANGKKWPWER